MRVEKISFDETGLFSDLFLKYINESPQIADFYSRFPSIDSFKDQIEEKRSSFDPASRKILQEVLLNQYTDLKIEDAVRNNLQLISEENTFTITTGHQLNIFTGPLYFIYKILTVINACEELSKKYPGCNFVPVYWMASEDHDLEEISYFKLFGTKYTWDTDQTGAVGRMNPNSLVDIIKEMPGKNEVFQEAYSGYDCLADSVRCYVNALFGKYGLVVVDGDNNRLKAAMSTVFKDDLIDGQSKQLVEKCSNALNALGFKTQVNPRDINLFYLDGSTRERIVKNNSEFEILNTDIKKSEDEILELLENNPERFSPNVILRPLYQEMILPNLAYVGGPAEVVYWLQFKDLFDHYKIPFPILLPRNFVLFANHVATRKLSKTGLDITQLFANHNDVINDHVRSNSEKSITLESEKNDFDKMLSAIKTKASNVDSTLDAMVGSEQKKILRSISKMESKMLKAEKRRFQDFANQVEDLWEMLFPEGAQQERSQNFLNFYLDEPGFIDSVKELLEPLDLRYHILLDERE